MLDTINVTYHERMFESEDGIAGLGSEPFVSDYKTLPYHALIASFPGSPRTLLFRTASDGKLGGALNEAWE